jgi:hypothetical protein
MVRIEKAYTGYCVHQEEASQALQDLEKNETVKAWLEVRSLCSALTKGMQNTECGANQSVGCPLIAHKTRPTSPEIPVTPPGTTPRHAEFL